MTLDEAADALGRCLRKAVEEHGSPNGFAFGELVHNARLAGRAAKQRPERVALAAGIPFRVVGGRILVGPQREYHKPTSSFHAPMWTNVCEHCDGEHMKEVYRYDDLRGWICPTCDSALDEMFADDPEEES